MKAQRNQYYFRRQIVNPEYLLGVGKTGGRVRLLLDIEKVLMSVDIVNTNKAAGSENREADN